MEIPVPDGFKTMQELSVGDTVFDENGEPCEVLYATDIMFGRTCYEVVFDDGTRVTVDAEHEWLTWDKAARKAQGRRVRDVNPVYASRAARYPAPSPRIVTTEHIRATLTVGPKAERNHSIPVCGAVAYEEKSLPVAPYTFGAWLGDGDSAGATITSVDLEIVSRIKADGYKVIRRKENDRAPNYGIGSRPEREKKLSVHSALRGLGVLKNKHIPELYLYSSVAQRAELLKGLMDTDGSVTPGGNCEFVTVRQNLATEALQLIRSLGIKAVLLEDRAKLNGKDCGPRFRITFTPNTPVFNLSRKLSRQRAIGRQSNRTTHRYIVDVVPVESVPVRCIKVSNPNSLFLCSRSFIPTHNTRSAAEWILERVRTGQARRISLIGSTAADTRDVMIEGESGILNVARNDERPLYEPSKRRLTFPNGAIATAFSADVPERLRGPQSDTIWGDEPASWSDGVAVFDMAMFGLRLGSDPRAIFTGTPKPTSLIRQLREMPTTVVTRGGTMDNAANLAPQFLDSIVAKYQGTRLGRQELDGELLEDVEGALWNWGMFTGEGFRLTAAPSMKRIVVGLDPAASSNPDSDETGIIVAGLGHDGRGYVLADASLRASPNDWAKAAASVYGAFQADRIIAERNNGGEMVEAVLRTAAPNVPVKTVWASRGKHTRAEPISALYEQAKISHIGTYPDLETQLTTWVPGDDSPDRLDALVWALSELMLEPTPKTSGFSIPTGYQENVWK